MTPKDEQLIPVAKLTKRQREILQRMVDGEELSHEEGGGWWIGDDRTNGKIGFTFLRHSMISEDYICGCSSTVSHKRNRRNLLTRKLTYDSLES